MLWLPLNAQGPVRTKTETRAMTLVELTDLPTFLKKGKVLCMLGPCAKCNRTKGRLLATILGLNQTQRHQQRLVSHIVIDSRTAREFISIKENGRG
jgi:hypothetical protein